MTRRKIFAGAKLKSLRAQHKLTQGELAKRLDISASYVNQLESNQRPLTASVMLAMAESFGLDLSALMTDGSDRLLADLREALADPLFGDQAPSLQELKTVSTNAPDMARSLLRLYETYRQTSERLAGVDAALARDPTSGIKTAYEEVRDFFHYADNYIDGLDRAAEALAKEIAVPGADRLHRLIAYCADTHDLKIALDVPIERNQIRLYDRQARVLFVNARLEPSTQYFQIASHLAQMEQTSLIAQIIDQAGFASEEARQIAGLGLANYYAGALQMPYGQFLGAAKAARYDIEELAHLFGASLEQVAHRLATLQRPRERGVPFFFARIDAAGTITKRHSATPLQFARFGGACPLWNVHRAFEARGEIIRQLAETPDGNRYLCLAWSLEKRAGGYRGPVRRYAYALGCEASQAGALIYADDFDLGHAGFEPIGISCRICERRNCPQRAVPPLAAAITVRSDRRLIVPYDIV